jgi:FkbM family methyltransferase
MNYNWAFEHIDKSAVKCIFELGARDCQDSVYLSNYFNCPVVAFECNPDCVNECKKTLSSCSSNSNNITLVEKAVHEENKLVTFKPFIRNVYDNIGASSLFEIDFVTNRDPSDGDYGKKNVQGTISVEATRLDTFIDNEYGGSVPDLICMDIQEAELIALKGLGEKLKQVKYVVFEASSVSTYTGGCCFDDVHNYLISNNFKFVQSTRGGFPTRENLYNFFDCLYENTM